MSDAVKIVVGLGNPGKSYHGTRHNVGFAVLDLLAAVAGVAFKKDPSRKAELATAAGVLLVKPTTYMNESGLCVAPLMRYFKLMPEQVLVVHDECDFPLGVMKFREKGSAAGHNGIKSLISHLGTDVFPRLRIGIGNSYSASDKIGFVLGKFKPDEKELAEVMIAKAADAVLYSLQHGTLDAANIYNETAI